MGGMFLFAVLTLIVFRNITLKRRNEKLQRERLENELKVQQVQNARIQEELQHRATELEMQVLRAQMNPHFIFNSLNSINRFILQNNTAKASEYLNKFSRMIRLILQNSHEELITLENELKALQFYLELEAERFDHHFEFKIVVNDELDVSNLKVPPLIIQPYAENAIWHGLMQKEEKGHLVIELFQEEQLLCCKIIDNGIGRRRAAELKSKSAFLNKSMGMHLVADRVANLQHQRKKHMSIMVFDIVLPDGSAGGTEVLLKIPVL